MTALEVVIEELKDLPLSRLEQAADYVRALKDEDKADRLAALKASAGCISDENAEAFEQAMQDFERIDVNEW